MGGRITGTFEFSDIQVVVLFEFARVLGGKKIPRYGSE
jgi:hypothetical protein